MMVLRSCAAGLAWRPLPVKEQEGPVAVATQFEYRVVRAAPFSWREWFKQATASNENRLFLWTPVAMGAGIGIYFGLPVEPQGAAMAVLLLLASVCFYRIMCAGPSPAMLLLMSVLIGFMTAKAHVAFFTGPAIAATTDMLTFTGFIEHIERGQGGRIKATVRLESASGLKTSELPRKARISGPAQKNLRVGHYVEGKARLFPLLTPVMPGGYDFARAQWLAGIGASGHMAAAYVIRTDRSASTWLQLKGFVHDLRSAMAGRIRTAMQGENGLLAVALITGERAALPQHMEESLQASGLAHIVSISGLHMSLVAGGVFWMLRAIFALSTELALAGSIKKWSAATALLVGLIYLAVSGCEVPTQRSYIMVAIMFAAIIVERPALSLRNVALAAIIVLFLDPAAVLQPGLQMSFLAVTGLVSFFECWRQRESGWFLSRGRGGWPVYLARRVGAALFGLAVTTIIAGICTGPAAAYHFNRVAPYGLIGNLLALPVVSAIVMPMALLGTLLMPLGLEPSAFRVMEIGLKAVMAVSDWTAGLPGAQWVVPRQGVAQALAMASGLLFICLIAGRARWLGLPLIALGLSLAPLARQPDVLIERSAGNLAIRNEAGRLVLAHPRRSRFAAQRWLLADGDSAAPSAAAQRPGFTCASGLCTGMAKGKRIAYADKNAEGRLKCPEADILIAAFPLRGACQTIPLRIDRFDVWRHGAHALHIDQNVIRVETARQRRGRRPWVVEPQRRRRSTIESRDFSNVE
jgi:competence protein ComEC